MKIWVVEDDLAWFAAESIEAAVSHLKSLFDADYYKVHWHDPKRISDNFYNYEIVADFEKVLNFSTKHRYAWSIRLIDYIES